MKKQFVLITISIIVMSAMSCIPTSESIQTVADGQRVLVSSVAELKALVKESGVIDQAKAEKVFAEAEKVLSQGEEILVAIDGKEGIEMVKAGVTASSAWNPYAAPILLAINVLQGLGLFGLGKKNADKGTAITELVAGVEKMKAGANPKEAFVRESAKTRNIVSLARNKAA